MNPNIVLIPTTPPNDELGMEMMSKQNIQYQYLFYSDLYHKPRGNGGIFVPVEDSERIRVTSKRGKILKILFKSSVFCDWSRLSMGLFLVTGDPEMALRPIDNGFTIESCIPLKNEIIGRIEVFVFEFELKIFYQSNNVPVLFQLSCIDAQDMYYSCMTLPFYTHDSGRVRKAPDTPVPEVYPVKKQRVEFNEPRVEFTEPPETELFPHSIEVNGNVKAMGFFRFSDLRYKTDIEDIKDAFEIIKNLDGKTYVWNEDFDVENVYNGERVIGLIAQEVRKVLPEVVRENEEGYLSVDYADIVPVLIEAFKYHVSEFTHWSGSIEHDISDLKAKISEINERESAEPSNSTIISEKTKKHSSGKKKIKRITTDVRGDVKTITMTQETVRVVPADKEFDYDYGCKCKASFIFLIFSVVFFTMCTTTVILFMFFEDEIINQVDGTTVDVPTDAYDNRILNPGFDLLVNDKIIGWDIIGTGVSVYSYSDSNFIRLNCDGEWCGIQQSMSINLLQKYFTSFTFSISVRVLDSGNLTSLFFPIQISFYDTTTDTYWYETTKLTIVDKDEWQKSSVSDSFNTYGQAVTITEAVIWIRSLGEILVDDVSFTLDK